jgi:hypothetical protein
MSDRPTGKELQVCKALQAMVKLTDQMESALELVTPSDTDFHISVKHAREGVRTNGWEYLCTILDAMTGLRRFRHEVSHGLETYKKIDVLAGELLERAEELFSIFKVCPICEGRKGKKSDRKDETRFTKGMKQWDDCEECDGRGIILRGKK